MRNKKGLPLMITGLLLAAAALLLTAFNLYEEQRAAQQSMHALAELFDEIRGHLPAEHISEGMEERETENMIADYLLNPGMDMPTKEADGHAYIGILAIPALELELPVMSQWSYPNLQSAPCRYTGSAYLDNMIIAAHNYACHFGRLKELAGGETVTFTDVDGNVFHYEVVLTETLMPEDLEEMESDEWDLSLFTCTIGGSYRVTVRCRRAEEFGDIQ